MNPNLDVSNSICVRREQYGRVFYWVARAGSRADADIVSNNATLSGLVLRMHDLYPNEYVVVMPRGQ